MYFWYWCGTTTEVAGTTRWDRRVEGKIPKITTYLSHTSDSELQQYYRSLSRWCTYFKALRLTASSELEKTETIDVMDGTGCNIRVDPREIEDEDNTKEKITVNEEWISDKRDLFGMA